MKRTSFAKFIKTAVFPKDYPKICDKGGNPLPEVAVVGRSNVGKSTLLNDVFQSTNLVKTSSTPGKTQALNFFSMNDKIAFADLPGYGYAKVPLAIKKQWGPMVEAYLKERDTLKLILLLLDIRRVPNEDDLKILEWVMHYQKAMILVLTKVDQVNQSERIANTKKILAALPAENLHVISYSAPKSLGRDELMRNVFEAIKDEEA